MCNHDLLSVFLCEHFTWKSLQTNLFAYFNLFTHLSRSLYSKRVSSLESHRIPGSAQNLRRDTPEWFFGSFQCIERIHHAVLAAVKPSAFIFYSSLPSLVIFPPFFLYTRNIHTLAWRHCIEKRFLQIEDIPCFFSKKSEISITSFSIPPSLLLKGVLWCVHSADVENTLQSHWGTIEREWRKRSMLWRVYKMSREFQEMFYTWCSSLFSSLFLFFLKFYLFLTPPTFYSSLCGINPAVVMFPQGFDFTRIYDGKFKWGKIAFGESSNQCRNF